MRRALRDARNSFKSEMELEPPRLSASGPAIDPRDITRGSFHPRRSRFHMAQDQPHDALSPSGPRRTASATSAQVCSAEVPEIGVQYPVHLPVFACLIQGHQRLGGDAPRSGQYVPRRTQKSYDAVLRTAYACHGDVMLVLLAVPEFGWEIVPVNVAVVVPVH